MKLLSKMLSHNINQILCACNSASTFMNSQKGESNKGLCLNLNLEGSRPSKFHFSNRQNRQPMQPLWDQKRSVTPPGGELLRIMSDPYPVHAFSGGPPPAPSSSLPSPLDRSVGGVECARMKEKTVYRFCSTTHFAAYLLLQYKSVIARTAGLEKISCISDSFPSLSGLLSIYV